MGLGDVIIMTSFGGGRVISPERATGKQLQGFHSREYINFLETHSNQSDSEEEEEEMAEELGLGIIKF